MITTQSVDAIDRALKSALEQFPKMVDDIRDLVTERDSLLEKVAGLTNEINTMNVTVMDLREDKKAMDARIGALLAENARLEHALVSIGNAVKQSTQVQDSIAQLAAQTKNGKGQTVIDHEPANEKAA